MKGTVLCLNMLATVSFLMMGVLAVSNYRVASYSTYRELVQDGAFDKQYLAALPPSEHKDEIGHTVLDKILQIGDTETWIIRIAVSASIFCALNTVLLCFIFRKRPQPAEEN